MVIVTWNGGADLIQTLSAIEVALREDRTTEAFLIDNASTDNSADRAAHRFPWLRVIRNAANLGFGAANNVGFSQARGRYVLVLNPDAHVTRDAVDALVQFMESHPRAGACGPKIIDASARSISPWCARRDPHPLDVLFEYAYLYRLFPCHRLFARYTLGDWDHGEDRPVDALSGACMLVRREVIDQVGGFDEQFFMYGEDLDWCRRMRQAGWQVWFVAAATIRHWGARSTRQVGDHGASWSVESIVHYFRKWGSRSDLFKTRLALSLGCLLRSVAWLGAGCFRPRQARHAFSRSLSYLKNSWSAWTI